MATAIVPATHQYHLPKAERLCLIAGCDNPSGKISRRMKIFTEKQRQHFISLNGDDGLGNTA